MSTKKDFSFKGVPLNHGDVIRITPAEGMAHARNIDMVALDLVDRNEALLRVLLSREDALCINNPTLIIKANEVAQVMVIMGAGEAVPLHSGHQKFRPSGRIIFHKGEKREGGKVMGAFEGQIAAELNLGDIEVADVVHFDHPPAGSIFTPPSSEETTVPLWRE